MHGLCVLHLFYGEEKETKEQLIIYNTIYYISWFYGQNNKYLNSICCMKKLRLY